MSAPLNLVKFPSPSLANIPQQLRELADHLETEKYGPVTECIVVLNAVDLHIFGYGSDATSAVAHYLLAVAQRRLEDAMP